jgi:hypothetical protein
MTLIKYINSFSFLMAPYTKITNEVFFISKNFLQLFLVKKNFFLYEKVPISFSNFTFFNLILEICL